MRSAHLLIGAVSTGLWFCAGGLPSAAPRQSLDTPTAQCAASAEKPVAICFPERPLRLQRCRGVLVPDFAIDVWRPPETATVGYRVSYQLIIDGKDGPIAQMQLDNPAAFPHTQTPDLSREELPFTQGARYGLRVTVTPEAMAPYSRVSAETTIEDKPRIRGLVLGVSNYADSANDLNYTAKDAEVFYTIFNHLLGENFDVQLDLRTSTNKKPLDKLSILNAIREIGEQPFDSESRLCGDKDWYVFYYSGHGIVAVDGNVKNPIPSRYLSTPEFDRLNIPRTSIRVTELANMVFDTSVNNVLVVLDSCFSGSHDRRLTSRTSGSGRGSGGGEAARRTQSGKLLDDFVDGQASTARLIEGIPKADGAGDAEAFKQRLGLHAANQRHGLVLSASSVDREAEEGPVRYELQDGERLLLFQRASVEENRQQQRTGYGLYTFALLANLLAQLPRGANVDALLPDGLPPSGQKCELNFERASNDARSQIEKLAGSRGWTLQVPEAVPSGKVPALLPCRLGGE